MKMVIDKEQFLLFILIALTAVCGGLLLGKNEDLSLSLQAQSSRISALEARVNEARTPRIEVKNASIWTSQGELVVVKE